MKEPFLLWRRRKTHLLAGNIGRDPYIAQLAHVPPGLLSILSAAEAAVEDSLAACR